MWGKNQKHQSNDEQNQFTAYLVIAVRRSRQDLCAKLFADSGRPEVSRQ